MLADVIIKGVSIAFKMTALYVTFYLSNLSSIDKIVLLTES